jgi:cold shock CspA family protein
MRSELNRRDVLRALLGLAAALSPLAALARPAFAKPEGWVAGTVAFFDERKGFGYVAADDGAGDVLLHIACLRASGYQSVQVGARLECVARQASRGRQAMRVLRLERPFD